MTARLRKDHGLREPPRDSLRILVAAGASDYSVALLSVRLLDSILGTRSILTDGFWRLHDGDAFPRKVRNAARAVAAWGSSRGIVLNEAIRAREEITKAIITMRRSSPYGRRRVRVANEIRAEYPPRKPESSATGDRLQQVPILCSDVGAPLTRGLIRRLASFAPSRIEIRLPKEPWYAASTLGAAYISLEDDGYTVTRIALAHVVPSPPPGTVVEGVLNDYFETGTEGVVWAVIDQEERGYDALHFIEEGDHLQILDELGHRIWSGKIRCDSKAGWRRYPGNPKYGQPCALGYWIHWTQKGFMPNEWARFFIRGAAAPLRAILRKKAQRRGNEQ